MTGRPVSRRQALVLGGLGVAAVATGAAGWALSTTPTGSAPPDTAPDAVPAGVVGEDLVEPPVLDSRDGRLAVDLVAASGARLAGRDTRALGYNGGSPGPTLRVRPGDELALRLANRLDQPTNLHTHGLRVSPQANSDNPFVTVEPGASFDYRYRIPADHPAGTRWYHPHHHGTVADQLFGGLAGALLVDAGPELPVERDRVLLVTDTTLRGDRRVAPVGPMDRMLGRQGQLVLVNGQLQPTVRATTGTVQRWRVINGCTSRILPLRLSGPGLSRIAHDGTYLPAPDPAETVLLAPGNRVDVLVRAEQSGRFDLIADAYDRGGMGGMGGMGGSATSAQVTLATLVVDGPTRPAPPLPATLPTPPIATGPVTNRRVITFAMGMGGMGGGTGGMGMTFAIDGRRFEAARDDQTVRFGAVEEWTILNTSPMAHPFHLHVWGFTVVADSAGSRLPGTPQDVVLVPARGWIRIRIPFTAYSGRSVYHCHILDHEDAGMMATVNVTEAG